MEQEAKIAALEFVSRLLMTGGKISNLPVLTDEMISFLRQTVLKEEYILYRGIYLMNGRVASENIAQLNALQIGDILPAFLMKNGNGYASYSKKLSVAKRYYKEGKVGIIVEATVPATKILCDLENIRLLDGYAQVFDEEDLRYGKTEKEVIVLEPIESTIIAKYGVMKDLQFKPLIEGLLKSKKIPLFERELMEKYNLSYKTIQWLTNWVLTNKPRMLTKTIVSELMPYRIKNEMILYRGENRIRMEETLNKLTSWSKSKDVSEEFTVYYEGEEMNEKQGRLFSCSFKPEDCLVDLTNFKFGIQYEQEVIILPGKYDIKEETK